MAESRPTVSKARLRSVAAAGVVWHAAWAVAVAVAMGAVAAYDRPGDSPELSALGAGGMAALLGAMLSMLGVQGRATAILIWAIGAALACHLTGGVGGPLAAWCLAPAAAATAFRSREMLSLGAAAALAALAVTILDGAMLVLPAADPALSPWLSTLALVTVTVGFVSGLIGFQGAVLRDARRGERADRILELLDSQPLLLATLDLNGRVLAAAGAAIGAVSSQAIEGKSLGSLTSEDDLPALAAALHEAARVGRASVYVTPADQPDGWLEISLRATDSGHLVAAVRDAHEQRLRERRQEVARIAAEQQNAGKSRFLANMSHELRTPLNAIMGFSDIMRQRLFGPMGDRYAEYAGLIHESGEHLLELINDVLDMSKIEAERFELAIETFDAGDAVEAVLRLMRGQADRAGVHLRSVLPTAPLQVEADRRAVKQIALNLISNALKFTPRGGAVTVTVQGAGDTLEIVVADTGVGIAQDDLDRLGLPYEQAGDAQQRATGSGLGLSLVRAFARLHGGEMAMESQVGEGTTVSVRLPVISPDTVETPIRKRL